ncbi:MAG: prolyl oligopeptidase family serine peptidase [Pseudomonadota bacterium]
MRRDSETTQRLIGLLAGLALAVAGCSAGTRAEPPSAPDSPALITERLLTPAAARSHMQSVLEDLGGQIEALTWATDGVWFLSGPADNAVLQWQPFDGGPAQPLGSAQALHEALASAGIESDIATVRVGEDKDEWRGTLANGRTFRFDVSASTLLDVSPGQRHATARLARPSFPIAGWDRYEQTSPDGQLFATLVDHNLGLRRRGEERVRLLTQDGTAQNEVLFGSDLWESSGENWSPDGRWFIARQHDARALPGIPIVNHLTTPETVTPFRYWARAGEPLPLTDFLIFDVPNGTARRVAGSRDSDHLAFFIDIAPDNSEFVFLRYARDLSTLEVIAVDLVSGRTRKLYEETVESGWVKWPGGPQTLTYLPSGDGFVWRSERSGLYQFYRYDRDGRVEHALTDGALPVGELVSIDEAGGWLYFMGPDDVDHPYDDKLQRVRLDGSGERVTLTPTRGQHAVRMADDHSAFVSEHSHLDRPPQTDLHLSDGQHIATLAPAAPIPQRANWPAPEEVVVTAADGETTVHAIVFKPHGFDPTRRYPVVERIYGGMQSNVMNRHFMGHSMGWPGGEYYRMLSWFNALGFVVVTMDTPGTPGRGRDFNLATHGHWPDGIIADHASALTKIMATRPWMDADRVAIEGNSWGGQLALRGLVDAPEVYRAAVATVPETDLLDHIHWIEFQNGTPVDNPDAYEKGLPAMAGRMQGDILLIHGTADVNVPVSNTLKMADALIAADKPFELLIVPGVNHPLQGKPDRYGYAVARIGRFLDRALGKPE